MNNEHGSGVFFMDLMLVIVIRDRKRLQRIRSHVNLREMMTGIRQHAGDELEKNTLLLKLTFLVCWAALSPEKQLLP